jgi:hypothetical protein
MLKILEKLLTLVVVLVFRLVVILRWIADIIMHIISLVIIVGVAYFIFYLGPPWILVSIFSVAFIGINFLVLALWRPKKIGILMKKYLK